MNGVEWNGTEKDGEFAVAVENAHHLH